MANISCESLADYYDRKSIDPDGFTIRPADPFDLRADKAMSRAEWIAGENARCDSLNRENSKFWTPADLAGDSS